MSEISQVLARLKEDPELQLSFINSTIFRRISEMASMDLKSDRPKDIVRRNMIDIQSALKEAEKISKSLYEKAFMSFILTSISELSLQDPEDAGEILKYMLDECGKNSQLQNAFGLIKMNLSVAFKEDSQFTNKTPTIKLQKDQKDLIKFLTNPSTPSNSGISQLASLSYNGEKSQLGKVYNPFKKNEDMGLLHVVPNPKCKREKQEDKHIIAVSCDAREVFPPINFESCYFCDEEEENDSDSDDDQNENNKKVEPFSDDQGFWESIGLEEIDITESTSSLTPLTLQIVRFIANDKNSEAVFTSVGRLLFPYMETNKSSKKAKDFVNKCFSEIHKIVKNTTIKAANDYQYAFETAMDVVMPQVWKEMLPTNSQYMMAPTLENLLTQFLLNVNYRSKAPVIYAFLRLHRRFKDIDSLFNIYAWIKVYDPDDNDATIKQLIHNSKQQGENEEEEEEDQKELDSINHIISILQHSYIPKNLHKSLYQIDPSALDKNAKEFMLPTKDYDTYNLYAITNYMSEAHNEFIHILEQSSDIHAKVILDVDDDILDYQLSVKTLSNYLFQSLVGRIDKFGHISNIEKVEAQFVALIKPLEYAYIVPAQVSLSSTVFPQIPAETLPQRFTREYPSKSLAIEQKSKIYKYIVKTKNTTGFKLLLEHVMSFILIKKASTTDLNILIENNIVHNSEKDSKEVQKITFMESAAYAAFKDACNKSKESFTIFNVVPLYKFVSKSSDQFQYRNTEFNIYYKIYLDYKNKFNLNSMPNVPITENDINTDTMLNSIVKLMNFLINNAKNEDEAIGKIKTFQETLKKDSDEYNDVNILIEKVKRPAYLLTAFKLLFNSIF